MTRREADRVRYRRWLASCSSLETHHGRVVLARTRVCAKVKRYQWLLWVIHGGSHQLSRGFTCRDKGDKTDRRERPCWPANLALRCGNISRIVHGWIIMTGRKSSESAKLVSAWRGRTCWMISTFYRSMGALWISTSWWHYAKERNQISHLSRVLLPTTTKRIRAI